MKDTVYAGDMENHKYEIPNYKTKKRVSVSREKHIIVRDTHEPIVSRDDYNRVQELIKARHTPPRHSDDNIFRSILFCSECGKKLTLAGKFMKAANKTTVRRTYYRCMYHYSNPDKCTHHNYIYYEELYRIVEQRIRKVLRSVDNLPLETLKRKSGKQGNQDKVLAERSKIEKRLSMLSKMIRKLYEDYAQELLDDMNYNTMLRDYQQEQKTLTDRLKTISTEVKQEDTTAENLRKLKKVAAQYAESQLSAEMLNKLVGRIEVKHSEQIDNGKKQEINIIYRFINTSI